MNSIKSYLNTYFCCLEHVTQNLKGKLIYKISVGDNLMSMLSRVHTYSYRWTVSLLFPRPPPPARRMQQLGTNYMIHQKKKIILHSNPDAMNQSWAGCFCANILHLFISVWEKLL